jgi:hypothetical protein
MTNLPRLELTEDPNKNNDFIIFPHSINGKKSKNTKITTSKTVTKKRFHSTKKMSNTKKGTRKKGTRNGLFNIFS